MPGTVLLLRGLLGVVVEHGLDGLIELAIAGNRVKAELCYDDYHDEGLWEGLREEP